MVNDNTRANKLKIRFVCLFLCLKLKLSKATTIQGLSFSLKRTNKLQIRFMKKLILLVVVCCILNASSCEPECDNCLYASLVFVPTSEVVTIPRVDFPFHSIVNIETNQSVWNLDSLAGEDSIYIHYMDVTLPIHPDKEISSFDFKDKAGNTIGSVIFEVDLQLNYSEGCKDYLLQLEGEPIIDIDFEEIEINVNSNSYYSCLPTLEILL